MAERLTITHLGAGGDGVAAGGEGPLHVPLALPGETVLTEWDGKRARLIEVEVRSADRVEPFCPYFGRCGGCVFQHLEQIPYAAWKRGKVVSALARAGVQADVQPLVDAHGAGRRRIVLHVRRVEGEIKSGFMEAGTHRLVPIETCPITVPALAEAGRVAEALARQIMSDKPLDVAVTATMAGLDVDLRGSGQPGERKVQALIQAAQQLGLARLSLHGAVLIEIRRTEIKVGSSVVVPPPGSFLQATEAGEEALAGAVLEAAEGRRRVLDLFSGIGPFALRLAERADVHAVESQAAMLAALDRGARETPGTRRVTTETRDLFRRPLLPLELDRYDLAVIDPPRQGAEAQVAQLAASSLDRVIMVSCDPVTFARDAGTLIAAGFSLAPVRPVDQFKWSAHVELVGVFSRLPVPRRKGVRRR